MKTTSLLPIMTLTCVLAFGCQKRQAVSHDNAFGSERGSFLGFGRSEVAYILPHRLPVSPESDAPAVAVPNAGSSSAEGARRTAPTHTEPIIPVADEDAKHCWYYRANERTPESDTANGQQDLRALYLGAQQRTTFPVPMPDLFRAIKNEKSLTDFHTGFTRYVGEMVGSAAIGTAFHFLVGHRMCANIIKNIPIPKYKFIAVWLCDGYVASQAAEIGRVAGASVSQRRLGVEEQERIERKIVDTILAAPDELVHLRWNEMQKLREVIMKLGERPQREGKCPTPVELEAQGALNFPQPQGSGGRPAPALPSFLPGAAP